ncbi:MAG: XrtA/PEP-CTERM system-associated ATPase [Alphaproteobacteria bacterium]
MYTEFYNLTGQPFQLTPDHRFFFNSSVHKRALAHLTFGMSQGEGFIVITGDVGAGKTTLMGYLMSTLDREKYISATVVTTQLAADDMLRMVASAFDLEQENADKATLLRRIESFCRSQHDDGRNCLLLVDEVQNLTFQALEELRMLSNFQHNGVALLQSILLGQPQFRRTLASNNLDQLRQRVIASYHLGPISAQETRDYIRHRLNAVGWKNDPVITEDAFSEIYRETGGVPRRINVLCSRVLLYGFLDEKHELDGVAVSQVATDLQRETEQVLETGEAEPVQGLAPTAAPVPAPPRREEPPAPQQPVATPVAATPEPPADVESVATDDFEVNDDTDDADNADLAAHDEAPPPRGTRPALIHEDDPAPDPVETAPLRDPESDPVNANAESELAALRTRLENAEALMQRHERMLRWTQLMLKHHERMLRRRLQKAMSNA